MKRLIFGFVLLLVAVAALPVVAQIAPQELTTDTVANTVLLGRIPQPTRWQELDMAWSPDGTRLAVSDHLGILTYDITPAGIRPGLKLGDTTMRCVAWSPDGALIAGCVTYDGAILIWNARTGEQVAALSNAKYEADHIAFSPDGTMLAVESSFGVNKNGVRVWGVWSNNAWQPFTPANAYRVQKVAELQTDDAGVADFGFSPDSQRLFTTSNDDLIRIWEVPSGELAHSHEYEGAYAGEYSRDGRIFAFTMNPNIVQIVDAITFEEIATSPSLPDPTWLVDLNLSPDGSLVAVAVDNYTTILDAATGEIITDIVGHPDVVWKVAFSPDGTLLASLGWNDGVRLWGRGSELAMLPTFTPIPSPTYTPAPTATPIVLTVGGRAEIHSTAGDRLNMRGGAGRGFDIVAKLDAGTLVTVLEGPQVVDDLTWWKVRTDDGLEGWVVDFVDGEQTLVPIA